MYKLKKKSKCYVIFDIKISYRRKKLKKVKEILVITFERIVVETIEFSLNLFDKTLK